MHSPTVNYNIGSVILKRAEIDPDTTAIIFENKDLSYKDLADRVRRLALDLNAKGVCPGDRVAFLGLNQTSYFETLFAAHCIGAIFIPLNYRLSGPELQYIVNDAQVHTLVVDSYSAPVLSSIQKQLCCTRYILSFGTETNKTLSDAEPLFNSGESFEEIMENSSPIEHLVESKQHDIAIIMYTSGTTGKPKGAMLSHGNLMWNNIQAAFTFSISSDDTSLVCAPLFHVGGLNVTSLSTLMCGGSLVIHRSFDAFEALRDIQRYGVSTLFAAPAMLNLMANQESFSQSGLGSLTMIIVGSAPVPPSLLQTYIDCGIEINQGYGLTETSPMVSFLTARYTQSKMGSAGKPGLFGEVKIVGPDGEKLDAGHAGEILYRGANVMLGYWNRPLDTARAIDPQGWFHTGDAGYLDQDGFLYISDRIKDMVISGGENVYPAEVESVLYDHPAIKEVAIIGLPHPKWGEAVTAVLALNKNEKLALEELRSFSETKLARYKLPLAMHIVDALPRNPAGKVLKYQLRGQYLDSRD